MQPMIETRFLINKFEIYDEETRILFDIKRVDESRGLGLQADVVFDTAVFDIEMYIAHEYLPSKGITVLTDGGLLCLPQIKIGDKSHSVQDVFTWFMLIDEDERFDILNNFLVARQDDVINFTHNLFAQRASLVQYTVNLAA